MLPCFSAGARCVKLWTSGRGAAWLARLLGVQEVPGSNPGGPTKFLLFLSDTYGHASQFVQTYANLWDAHAGFFLSGISTTFSRVAWPIATPIVVSYMKRVRLYDPAKRVNRVCRPSDLGRVRGRTTRHSLAGENGTRPLTQALQDERLQPGKAIVGDDQVRDAGSGNIVDILGTDENLYPIPCLRLEVGKKRGQ